ncbi:hypothetical protein ABET41_08815 [Metabacillus fastidiosus]|uniref:Uncharacterized protein n=1 Tax=Metabacillus fastidiosus TaxID=1458 RepID=A0ABU6NTX1_9BACI|nr:hypothetical protein [Metabacillus fastidiosus]MED4400597.1 hypothetical protein [Metabacillus fastidiosus]MED4464508.1 hypothetical protein [Metabacillus fastidiosus]
MTKRRIQQKYREKIEQKKISNKHFLTVLCYLSFGLIIFLWKPIDTRSTVAIDKIDSSESQWMSVAAKIDRQLEMTSEQYTGISIDLNPKPVKYILKTSIQENYINKEADQLINITNGIITSNNLPSLLREDESYEIIIIGKDKQVLSNKIFH